ncbi:MAG: single-stranded-DNA-specific exonuclease RecJ [Candidatus Magasanikbacteria bacterium]|nr:single-stranded-DNA-specific exonuclease RecJ [Candidatus Magasanikbacteria bacterium]
MPSPWLVSLPAPPAFLANHPELPPLVAQLLYNRGLTTQEAIDEFLNPDYSQDVPDPFLFNDMARAVAIIFDCIGQERLIIVHGDYDADGVCAAALLVSTLRELGARADVFIPHRERDGYGLNLKTIDYLHQQGARLIITCDCGISNREEINRAKELGMQVIVTDHHTLPPELPPADAILHPLRPGERYPDKTLSGGGVAFKLAQALLKKHREQNPALPHGQTQEGWEKWLLDRVAISTVADMVPLLGESRTLARYGLVVLGKTQNLGLRALLASAGLTDEQGRPRRGSFTADTIAYKIAPRINAAGRMDHANVAYALLMADTAAEAERLAAQLEKNNSDRQRLTDKLVTAARYQVVKEAQEEEPLICVVGDQWPTGLLGLIAGKIREEFGKPTVVVSRTANGLNGSGRSVPGFNLIATLQTMPELFTKFGGHPQACGFTLTDETVLGELRQRLRAAVAAREMELDLTPQLKIDAEVDLDDINWKLADLLEKFAPFGVGNPEPVYAARGLTVKGREPVGSDGKHLRIMVSHRSSVVRKTIAFGFGDTAKHPRDWKTILRPGVTIDLVFSVGVNEWNGNRELELLVRDLALTPSPTSAAPAPALPTSSSAPALASA